MKLRIVSPDDYDTLDAVADLVGAASAVDAPWFHTWTAADYRAVARLGMDGEPPVIFVAEDGGRILAQADVRMSERDNLHLAWTKLVVHPDVRRRGVGSELLEHVTADVKARGRTSMGSDGWDADNARGFAAGHRFEVKGVDVCRRRVIRDVDPVGLKELLADATEAAASYDLVRVPTRTPADLIDEVVVMVGALNDRPVDDVDIEDEVFSRERVWGYEDVQRQRNHRLYRLIARHRETGELAGNTVVIVKGEFPERGYQHETSVVRAHRGHRLGALLKASMLEWLAEAEPQLRTIETWNAESNEHMVAVNDALGYRVMGRALAFQRDL
jgi:GNAT superfamily N-acetyltransferase